MIAVMDPRRDQVAVRAAARARDGRGRDRGDEADAGSAAPRSRCVHRGIDGLGPVFRFSAPSGRRGPRAAMIPAGRGSAGGARPLRDEDDDRKDDERVMMSAAVGR